MADISAILVLVSVVALIIGLIRPSFFNPVFKREMTRKSILLIFGGALVIFSFGTGDVDEKKPTKEVADATGTQGIEDLQPKETEEREDREDSTSEWVCGDGFKDERDGQIYSTVKIGEQCWMAENLNYKANNSLYIAVPGYTEYGRFYEYSSAISACPSGWHLPSDGEWHALESHLATGSCDINRRFRYDCSPAGTAIKALSWGGSNSSGFAALPGGFRLGDDNFISFTGKVAHFWSSTEFINNALAFRRAVSESEVGIDRTQNWKTNALSVRCVRD